MSSPSRGRRALLVVAVLLAIPLLGAPATWFWIQRTADRKWEDTKLRIQELTRDFPAVLPPSPLTGTSKELQIHFVSTIRDAARRSTQQKVDACNMILSKQLG